MAIIKAAKGGGSLGRAINYAAREGITSGKDCPDSPRDAIEQIRTTKELYDQTEGRAYKHYIQSFNPDDKITPKQANALGREWAEKNFPGHEVFIGTHADRNHIHNHIVVNSVNFENGKKLQVSAKDLERFKLENDKISEREGLSIPEKGLRRDVTTWNMNKQKILERVNAGENVKSYVLDTAVAVQHAAGQARNKQEFIQEMSKQGYSVDWQEQRKNVTFTDKDGHKVRLKNLEKTFNDKTFTKEGLQYEFSRAKEQNLEPTNTKTRDRGNKRVSDQCGPGSPAIGEQHLAAALRAARGAIREAQSRGGIRAHIDHERDKQAERDSLEHGR